MKAGEPTTTGDGCFATARKVADAVIYEGYVLYPYRASAQKNQIRWQFGVLAPRPHSEATGSESWALQTECVLEAPTSARVRVQVRFLRVRSRLVEQACGYGDDEFVPVASLDVDGQLWTTWEESTEHQVDIGPEALGSLVRALTGEAHEPAATETAISLEGCIERELLRDGSGRPAGRLLRELRPVAGRIEVTASPLDLSGLTRLRVRVENLTPWPGSGAKRDETVRNSLVAVHVLAAVDEGRFISLLDPPKHCIDAVAACRNIGCFPVLIGEGGTDDVVLASPIILYDHPEVAPESQGDMFDATEIDEILALRVLTLTEEEKREARGTDDLAAAIIDRCDAMPPEMFERLHGAIRSLRPPLEPAPPQEPVVPWWDPEMDAGFDPAHDTIVLGSVEVGKGAKVRLNPTRRADAQDLFLAGRSAVVAGVFHDVDGDVHVAVVLDDDPAAEFHDWYGRYLYFHPEEVEVLEGAS